jgi:hypothetical protein
MSLIMIYICSEDLNPIYVLIRLLFEYLTAGCVLIVTRSIDVTLRLSADHQSALSSNRCRV